MTMKQLHDWSLNSIGLIICYKCIMLYRVLVGIIYKKRFYSQQGHKNNEGHGTKNQQKVHIRGISVKHCISIARQNLTEIANGIKKSRYLQQQLLQKLPAWFLVKIS